MTHASSPPAAALIEAHGAGTALLRLSGLWRIDGPIPPVEDIGRRITAMDGVCKIVFDAEGVTGWDSALLVFLNDLEKRLADQSVTIDAGGLPVGIGQLLAIASAVPEKVGARGESPHPSFLVGIGQEAQAFFSSFAEILTFIGDAALSVLRLLSGKAGFRMIDLVTLMRQCGADALPIVSMISLLVGLILAFVGAIQLSAFGAQIYVADLVGIAMVRVLGAVMTGIIMTGRTGAAFAAQLGTMQVNEELDALEALGLSPMDFLVLPRVLALTVMMPLLCLYADLMGILGGMIVGVTMLDISMVEYFIETRANMNLNHLWIGLFHALVFGVLVSLAGCLRGIQCGRSASAVGQATTSAVVTGIVSIVVATALITAMCSVIGI